MTKMINSLTGSLMYVEDSRVAEYKALGHRLANRIPTLKEISRPGEIEKALKNKPVEKVVEKVVKAVKTPAKKSMKKKV